MTIYGYIMQKLGLFQKPVKIAIAGASGGIGSALLRKCQESENIEKIYALSRQKVSGDKVQHFSIDYNDIATLDNLSAIESIDVLVIATGALTHREDGPEKRIEQVSKEELLDLYHTNAMGPILLARALHHAFPRQDRSVCVALSARVGSISDNKLGGWYSYRASKAALNMLFHSYAIEAVRNSQSIVSLYHPGTVETRGFRDYQSHMDKSKIFQPEIAAEYLFKHIISTTSQHNGLFIDYKGDLIPF